MERFSLYATGIGKQSLCQLLHSVDTPLLLWHSTCEATEYTGVACANSGGVSATQARKLRGLLAWGYFVSGCDDTRAYLWNLVGTANSRDVCVCRHGRETASPVGYERHLSQFRKSVPSLCEGGMSGVSSVEGGAA